MGDGRVVLQGKESLARLFLRALIPASIITRLRETMSSSNFKHSERVEALWPDDGTWHPAKVLKVKGNGVYLIQFVGWVEKYEFRADQLRAASALGSSKKNKQNAGHTPRMKKATRQLVWL